MDYDDTEKFSGADSPFAGIRHRIGSDRGGGLAAKGITVELEKNHRAERDKVHGFGVMNLKDAPMVPNSMARSMARKRTATNGATVLADQTHALSTAWNLGDCNNKFVLMFVTKEGELVFLRKGVLSDADKEAFYEVLENYK